MAKERQYITASNCLKGVSGKVIVDEKGIKDSWKEYIEKLMNENNEWDNRISAGDNTLWPTLPIIGWAMAHLTHPIAPYGPGAELLVRRSGAIPPPP